MSSDNISKVLAEKYFNQNLICFIVSYIGVFVASKYDICCLCYICYGLLMLTIFSLFLTISFYTWEYCSKKYYKHQKHRLDFEIESQKHKGL